MVNLFGVKDFLDNALHYRNGREHVRGMSMVCMRDWLLLTLCLVFSFLPAVQAGPEDGLLDPMRALTQPKDTLFGHNTQDTLLDPEQAFVLSITASDPYTLVARWNIADGYYLYKDKLRLSLPENSASHIAAIDLPAGTYKEDEFFGRQEVYYQQAVATVHLQRSQARMRNIVVHASYQGCAEIGVCYPPLTQSIPVTLAALETASIPASQTAGLAGKPAGGDRLGVASEQDRMAHMLTAKRFWALPAFLGFGLLLAFTPCVFPMIPILSSLIVGQGETLTRRRAFLLSLVYVLAMAITYTVGGVLAALLGQNIQAVFQNTWILIGFSALFVLLALSMFGFYQLQLPERWQNRLSEFSNRQRGGSYLGVAIMGLLSALIIGPCVAPPLIGVLTMIAATGDTVLGGTALFIMSLGMGIPLLLIGASAGRLLPRAGQWMERIKAVFGVLLLTVAIWLLERILPATVSMLLWAILLIVCATYMGALQPLTQSAPTWRTLVKGLGVVLLIYGILLLVGVASGGRDALQPLRGVGSLAVGGGMQRPLIFQPVPSVADVEREFGLTVHRPVLLNF